MITLPAAVRVYLCTIACDMRRGFDGLKMLAATVVGVDPLGGHLFVFCSRRADRVKILYWGVSRMQVETCRAVPKMGEGLPESAFGSRLQTTRSCCAQKAWW